MSPESDLIDEYDDGFSMEDFSRAAALWRRGVEVHVMEAEQRHRTVSRWCASLLGEKYI